MTGAGTTTVKPALGTRLVADLAANESGMALVYSTLDSLVEQFDLTDAAVIVDEPGIGRQVFRSGRRRIDGGDLALLESEPGLYTDPPLNDPTVDPALVTGLCTVALRMDLLRHDARHDALTGLYDRGAFQELLTMSVARTARSRWPFRSSRWSRRAVCCARASCCSHRRRSSGLRASITSCSIRRAR